MPSLKPMYPVSICCCSLEYTFRTIYWAVFGLKDPRTVELGGYHSRFTESLGYIVFGVYNWGAVIVLLNMLIAMMTRSFDKIAVSPCTAAVRTTYNSQWRNTHWTRLDNCQGPPGFRGPQA